MQAVTDDHSGGAADGDAADGAAAAAPESHTPASSEGTPPPPPLALARAKRERAGRNARLDDYAVEITHEPSSWVDE